MYIKITDGPTAGALLIALMKGSEVVFKGETPGMTIEVTTTIDGIERSRSCLVLKREIPPMSGRTDEAWGTAYFYYDPETRTGDCSL